jgi:hypothetical protein
MPVGAPAGTGTGVGVVGVVGGVLKHATNSMAACRMQCSS